MKKKKLAPTGVPAGIPLSKLFVSKEQYLATTGMLRSGLLMQGAKAAEFEHRAAALVIVTLRKALDHCTARKETG